MDPISHITSIISNMKTIKKYTSCKINLKDSDNNVVYLQEKFIKDKESLKLFLENLTFYHNISSRESDIKRFICNGTNNITICYKRSNPSSLEYNDSKKYFCQISELIIDKVINKTKVSNLYDDTFLNILFDDDYYEKVKYKDLFYKTDRVIILPALSYFYINDTILHKIVISISSGLLDESILESIVFSVFVIPDNYIFLKDIYLNYKTTKNFYFRETLIKELINQIHISPYHISKNSTVSTVNRYKLIKSDIEGFYSKLTVDSNNYRNILIQISGFHPHNFWTKITVEYRNNYKGHHKYIRLTEYLGGILYDDFLNCLENNISIDRLYESSFTKSIVDKYNISDECRATILESRYESIPLKQRQNMIEQRETLDRYHMRLNRNFEYIEDYHLKKGFNINKIYSKPFSKLAKICSLSLCITYGKDRNFIINIIPNTVQYIDMIGIDKTKKYLLSNTILVDNTPFDQDNVFYNFNKYNLKYIIEIIPLPCMSCNGTKKYILCNESTFETNEKNSMENIIPIDIYEPVDVAYRYESYRKDNFMCYLHIVIFNIIYNSIKNGNIRDISARILNMKRNLYLDNILLEDDDDGYLEKILLPYLDQTSSNPYIWASERNYPFIVIVHPNHILNKDKYVLWYCHFISYSDDELHRIIDRLDLTIRKVIRYGSNTVGFNTIIIRRDDVKYIFGDSSYDFNDYLINVVSLFDKSGNFKIIKTDLDNCIQEYTHFMRENKLYTYFHYRNREGYDTLHIHISSRLSGYQKSAKMPYEQFNTGQLVDLKNYRINNNYAWFNKSWLSKHTIRTVIDVEEVRRRIIDLGFEKWNTITLDIDKAKILFTFRGKIYSTDIEEMVILYLFNKHYVDIFMNTII